MKTTLSDWFKVLILLLDEGIIIAAVLLILHFLGVKIPIGLMISIALLVGVVVLVIHVKLIPSFHLKKVTGREGIIGLQGKVVKSLSPVGNVFVKGENWKAKSEGDYIEVDENVEIMGIKGLELLVRRVEKE